MRDLLLGDAEIYYGIENIFNIADDYIIIHGHTPVFYHRGHDSMKEILNHVYPEFYANGHKINIDMGTHYTKTCALLDLDTFEYHIFTTKD